MVPDGWNENHGGGIMTSRDPLLGGIIDRNFVSGLWFVIPNADDLPLLEGLATRDAAFAALQAEIAKRQRKAA